MFRINFGWDMFENVKEHLSALVHAYEDLSLCPQPLFLRTQAYSWESVCVGFSLRTRA